MGVCQPIMITLINFTWNRWLVVDIKVFVVKVKCWFVLALCQWGVVDGSWLSYYNSYITLSTLIGQLCSARGMYLRCISVVEMLSHFCTLSHLITMFRQLHRADTTLIKPNTLLLQQCYITFISEIRKNVSNCHTRIKNECFAKVHSQAEINVVRKIFPKFQMRHP